MLRSGILAWIDSLPFDVDELAQIAAAASRGQNAAVRIAAPGESIANGAGMRGQCHSGRVGLNGDGSLSPRDTSSVHMSITLARGRSQTHKVCRQGPVSVARVTRVWVALWPLGSLRAPIEQVVLMRRTRRGRRYRSGVRVEFCALRTHL